MSFVRVLKPPFSAVKTGALLITTGGAVISTVRWLYHVNHSVFVLLPSSMAAIQNSADSQFKAVTSRLDSVDTRLHAVDTRMQALFEQVVMNHVQTQRDMAEIRKVALETQEMLKELLSNLKSPDV